jgi:hypothetical protein
MFFHVCVFQSIHPQQRQEQNKVILPPFKNRDPAAHDELKNAVRQSTYCICFTLDLLLLLKNNEQLFDEFSKVAEMHRKKSRGMYCVT